MPVIRFWRPFVGRADSLIIGTTLAIAASCSDTSHGGTSAAESAAVGPTSSAPTATGDTGAAPASTATPSSAAATNNTETTTSDGNMPTTSTTSADTSTVNSPGDVETGGAGAANANAGTDGESGGPDVTDVTMDTGGGGTGGTASEETGAGGAGTGGGGAGGSASGGAAGMAAVAAGGAGGDATTGAGGGAGEMNSGMAGAGGAGDEPDECDTSPGMAMRFAEGVIDQMTGNIGADGPSGDGPRTLELWAKFTSANSWTAEQTIIELGRRNNAGDMVWGIDMSGRDGNGGRFGPYTNGVTDNNGSNGPLYDAPPDVGWLHLSWAYEGSGGEMVFTVNGEQLPIQDPGANYTLNLTPGIVTLGASQSFGATGWDGVMDEVRIWTIYRSPQEIADTMNVFLKGDEEGLAAYYNFDDSDGSFVDDVNATPSHRLEPCGPGNDDRCTANNDGMPTIVESDIPGPFTCSD